MAAKGKVLTLFFMDDNLEGRIKCSVGGSKCLAYKNFRGTNLFNRLFYC